MIITPRKLTIRKLKLFGIDQSNMLRKDAYKQRIIENCILNMRLKEMSIVSIKLISLSNETSFDITGTASFCKYHNELCCGHK